MHGIKKLSLAMFTFMMATSYVNASSACSTKEVASLNREVANIKAEYEIAEKEFDWNVYSTPDATPENGQEYPKMKFIKINISNLSENFYLEVSNDQNRKKWTVTSETLKDGALPFDWEDLSEVTKFTIKVMTSNKTGCSGEKFRTLTVTVPRYNTFSSEPICYSLPEDYYLCQDYVTFKKIDSDEFFERVSRKLTDLEKEKVNDEDDQGWLEKPISFIKKHSVAFIIGGILIVIAGGATYIIIKKRKGSKEI